MNKKRNVAYIKPEDPEFLKILKKQAGYDDRNHKFDELQNKDEDFVEDDESEQPQVVVLKQGDLTAQEADEERKRIEELESEVKADLNQKVIFKPKLKSNKQVEPRKRKDVEEICQSKKKKGRQLLSFGDDESDDED